LVSEGAFLLLEFVFESLVSLCAHVWLLLGPARFDAEAKESALLDLLSDKGLNAPASRLKKSCWGVKSEFLL